MIMFIISLIAWYLLGLKAPQSAKLMLHLDLLEYPYIFEMKDDGNWDIRIGGENPKHEPIQLSARDKNRINRILNKLIMRGPKENKLGINGATTLTAVINGEKYTTYYLNKHGRKSILYPKKLDMDLVKLAEIFIKLSPITVGTEEKPLKDWID